METPADLSETSRQVSPFGRFFPRVPPPPGLRAQNVLRRATHHVKAIHGWGGGMLTVVSEKLTPCRMSTPSGVSLVRGSFATRTTCPRTALRGIFSRHCAIFLAPL